MYTALIKYGFSVKIIARYIEMYNKTTAENQLSIQYTKTLIINNESFLGHNP